jgi:hypothetical protein
LGRIAPTAVPPAVSLRDTDDKGGRRSLVVALMTWEERMTLPSQRLIHTLWAVT